MCGRKTLTKGKLEIIEELSVDEWEEEFEPSYNIAPTQFSPVLRKVSSHRVISPMRWGLVPAWAKDLSLAGRMINARAETILEKPSFRNLVNRKRCIVITDGYYEWKKTGNIKTPYYIHHPEGALLQMAGLWDQWLTPENTALFTYTVITTHPRPDIARIHNRMPAILPPDHAERWLSSQKLVRKDLQRLLSSHNSVELEAYPVSPLVNSPANDSPHCIKPA